MPTLLTGDRLKAAVTNQTFIQGGDLNSVEGVKYDFHMGTRILKAVYGQPIELSDLSGVERSALRVDPGEAVFVLTREQLNLPDNIFAVLTPKRKLAHGGIIVLGGLSVDPLYKGPLWIGLYNFSSTPFPIQAGKKLIGSMFYELSESERGDFPIPDAAGCDDFPDDLINLIKNYKPVEIKSLTDALATTERRLDDLARELRDDRTWKKDFQEALEKQSREIDKLLDGLKEEKDARKDEDTAIRGKLEKLSSFFTGAKIFWFFAAILLGAFLQWWVPKLFETSPQPVPVVVVPAQPPTAIPAPAVPVPSPVIPEKP